MSNLTSLLNQLCKGTTFCYEHHIKRVYPIIAEQRGEVGGAQTVQNLYELGAVDGVHSGEDAAREQTQLQQLRDRLVLCRLDTARQEPPVLLLHVGGRQIYYE